MTMSIFNSISRALFTVGLLAISQFSLADSTVTKERTTTKLAEGIYEIRHPDAPDTFPQGNTTVIIGKRAVLVVDSCLLPSSTRQDIAQIRQWTSLPVTYLVNTHWHFDHTLGNATYAEAFPAIQIIASRPTQKIIGDYNPGVLTRYPSRAQRFQQVLDTGKDLNGETIGETVRKEYEKALAGLGPVAEEFKTAHQLAPNVSFEHELDIDLGDRPVRILFLGRANTAGDTVVYLPNDKLVATGDVLDHPVPYMFGGFPVDFVNTLRELAAIDANIFVPGHGDVQHDKTYITQVIDLMQSVNTEVEKEINDGKTLEEAQTQVPKALESKGWKEKFAGKNDDDQSFFDESFAGLVKSSYNQIKAR
ncbi:beta-lactamase-like protein [Candidatus Koribacter versatilis Ellin345]|uniref:Beta-lactamase-like protein n=1 Tax=Koribacter versatilis (strain Ellin345) TaxID=204669 RepID=Q1IVM6_KORVE|nr:MBL fold metallo-hydrolase [Candidatus Koribacter versatilis]ABF39074.1 beta-lactamase-like protein [Candidatus Koribacter versatilis Ellin345]